MTAENQYTDLAECWTRPPQDGTEAAAWERGEFPDSFFRGLSSEEVAEFRAAARNDYKAFDEINPAWHPVYRDECNRISFREAERQMCSDALTCQDACNLSGVARSLHEHLSRLIRYGNLGTHKLNTHPATVLFVCKLEHLAGYLTCGDVGKAMEACQKLAR